MQPDFETCGASSLIWIKRQEIDGSVIAMLRQAYAVVRSCQ
jgi:hypothetical protein